MDFDDEDSSDACSESNAAPPESTSAHTDETGSAERDEWWEHRPALPDPSEEESQPADGWPDADGWLDDSAGHGPQSSSEDWVRANHAPISNDGRSHTRTTFYPNDVQSFGPGQAHRDPSDRRGWASLVQWNDGVGSDKSRGSQNWKADKRRWLDTFSGQLESTDYQQERAQYILETMDMGPFIGARLHAEAVILGVLTLTMDADVHEFDRRMLNRDELHDLVDDLELETADVRQARKLVHRTASELISPDDRD